MFGLTQVIVSKNTADCYSSKVIRSTMGAIFRVNIIESQNLVKTLEDLKTKKYEILVTALEKTESIYNLELRNKIIVIGNEANGISKEVFDIADKKMTIPMLGKTESLNASIATGVILYEYVRRKLIK